MDGYDTGDSCASMNVVAIRTMLVHLNRPIRGDHEFQWLAEALPIMAFHSTTEGPNMALGVQVEADSRTQAERAAYDLVAGVLPADEIDHVAGDDDVLQDRQIMFWVLATRQCLRQWELQLAEHVDLSLRHQHVPGSLIWSTELAHHLALVAGNNLLRALDNAEGRFRGFPNRWPRRSSFCATCMSTGMSSGHRSTTSTSQVG